MLIQNETQDQLIKPFVTSLLQQFEMSDILKESLISGHEFKIGSLDDIEQEDFDLERKNEVFKDQL